MTTSPTAPGSPSPIAQPPRIDEFGQPIGPPVDTPLPVDVPATASMAGQWCALEPLDPHSHGGALFDAYSAAADARGWTYLAGGPFDSAGELSDWLDGRRRQPASSFFTIMDPEGPCGIAAYLRIDPMAPSVEVGSIHFAPRLQRTTAATEAMFLMMQRAFDTGYRRYEWKCDSLNAGSRAAAARLGFSYEGDFRQAVVYKGRSRDTSWYSIVADEWPERRTEFERWLDIDNFTDGQQRTALVHRT